MELKSIQTDKAPAAIGPYSQAIDTGPLLFVSGQLGMNPQSGELVSSEFAPQANQALENLKQIVLAGGSDLTRVVAVDVFVTDMVKFAEFNEIYQQFFSQHRPARAVIEVSDLPKGALVEIKCVAAT
ncbi:MAG: Rid family detoxifying hydrolase [Planctomycetota bacterium]|jgi:2-iminobutanoate/2-iminopropanoate deaminase